MTLGLVPGRYVLNAAQATETGAKQPEQGFKSLLEGLGGAIL